MVVIYSLLGHLAACRGCTDQPGAPGLPEPHEQRKSSALLGLGVPA